MSAFPKNLQGKIFLITFITIFTLVGLFFVFEYNKDKKNLYNQLIIHMMENSFTIRNSIESVRIPLLFQSILEEYAVNILEHKDILDTEKHEHIEIPPHEIHAVNTDGIVMASTKPELIGLSLENALQHKEEGLNNVLAGKAHYSIEQMEQLGVRVIDISVPVREEGKIIGALHYVEPYLKLERLIKESFWRHFIFALILIISLSLFINLFLTKMVTKPIRDLSGAMDKLRLKGTTKKIALSTKDEIGLLANSFNQMSTALQEREEEVKKYTTTLEEMVEERTKKLQDSHAQLIQTEKLASMGRLAGYIAHEINNPIGIMVSRAECILMDAQEKGYPDYLINDIKVIKKHSNRIATITQGILAFSRKSSVEFSPIDINEVIDDTVLLLEKQFINDNINFFKHFDYNIPKISGNANQLQQVFFNILNNARDAMPRGGTIEIRSHCNNNGTINISISDTGVGIPDKNLDKIFDPFFTTKEKGKGTGLGLSVTYGIIKEHNGQINVRGQGGGGTTFEILLPLEKNSMEA